MMMMMMTGINVFFLDRMMKYFHWGIDGSPFSAHIGAGVSIFSSRFR